MECENQVVELLYAHFCGQFPKTCRRCERVYPTLKDYVTRTDALPQAISYDIPFVEGDGATPIGAAVFAKCICGNTLTLATAELDLAVRLKLIDWARSELERRQWTPGEFLNHMRERLRQRAMLAPD